MPIAFAAFYIARRAFPSIAEPARIDNWRNAFLAVTAAGFLVPNFWAMLFVVALLVVVMGRAEPLRPALYLLLLFALPPVGMRLPGFAGIDNFLEFTPPFILTALILAPALFNRKRMKKLAPGGSLTDVFFFSYVALNCVLLFRDTTVTHGLRNAITFFMFSAPVYLVLSRWPRDLADIRIITLALVIPLFALAGIGIVEFGLRWHFYNDATLLWGADTGRYEQRSGFLRAFGSVLGPIAFGYFIMVAMTLSLPLMSSAAKPLAVRFGLLACCGGLIVTLSRGPWIGAALSVAAFVMTGRKALTRSIMLGFVGVLGLIGLAATPGGARIIALLPIIGGEASDTISYRARLAETGWQVVMENPLFGMKGIHKAESMQELIQGQGIIDLVNSYLTIALQSGLVGLALFLGALMTALYSVWSASRRARAVSEELSTYCRGYFAALIGILFVIGTTSMVAQVTEIYWTVAGLCVAMTRVTNAALAKSAAQSAAGLTQDDTPKNQTAPGKTLAQSVDASTLPPHLRQYVKK